MPAHDPSPDVDPKTPYGFEAPFNRAFGADAPGLRRMAPCRSGIDEGPAAAMNRADPMRALKHRCGAGRRGLEATGFDGGPPSADERATR